MNPAARRQMRNTEVINPHADHVSAGGTGLPGPLSRTPQAAAPSLATGDSSLRMRLLKHYMRWRLRFVVATSSCGV